MESLLIGTWNIWTLQPGGKDKELVKYLEEMMTNIIAIQEVRWKGSGVKHIQNSTIYYSNCDAKSKFGCGFIITGKLNEKAFDFNPVSEQIATIRIKTEFGTISLICCHAPTNTKSYVIKEKFYVKMKQVYENLPKNDIKIICGDFNAMTGREGVFGRTAGNDSLHEITNENGFMLISFAASKGLILSSTFFSRSDNEKGTWKHPKGNINQVDHILIDAKYFSIVKSVQSNPETKVKSDHYLVTGELNFKQLQLQKTVKMPKFSEVFSDLPDLTPPRSLKIQDDEKVQYCHRPNKKEIKIAISKLISKNFDGLYQSDDSLVRIVHEIIGNLWSDECLTKKLTQDSTATKYVFKTLAIILSNRLQHFVQNSRIDQIFVLRQILEKTREFSIDTHHLFIEFQKDYENDSNELYRQISNFGIPDKLVRLWKMIIDSKLCSFNFGSNIIIFQIILQNLPMYTNCKIFEDSVQLLPYSGGIDVIGKKLEDVKTAFLSIKTEAAKLGLLVNKAKTKYMRSTESVVSYSQFETMRIDEYDFKIVRNFIFQNFTMSSVKGTSAEILRKLTLANRYLLLLQNEFSTDIPVKIKKHTYKRFFIPFILDGAELWILMKNDERNIAIFERKMLRAIFGEEKKAADLYALYNDIDLITRIKIKRREWHEHVLQLPTDDPVQEIYFSNPENANRPQRRPPTTWYSQVRQNIVRRNRCI